MTIGELKKQLLDPESPLGSLPDETPILQKWNCAGYISVILEPTEVWVYGSNDYVSFPTGTYPVTAITIEVSA